MKISDILFGIILMCLFFVAAGLCYEKKRLIIGGSLLGISVIIRFILNKKWFPIVCLLFVSFGSFAQKVDSTIMYFTYVNHTNIQFKRLDTLFTLKDVKLRVSYKDFYKTGKKEKIPVHGPDDSIIFDKSPGSIRVIIFDTKGNVFKDYHPNIGAGYRIPLIGGYRLSIEAEPIIMNTK